MPLLDRQPIGRRQDRISETEPTPLQKHYINLSAIALVAGALTITALNAGIPMTSPLVKLFVLIGAPILVVTTGDAALRFWRSARAWMPVDRRPGVVPARLDRGRAARDRHRHRRRERHPARVRDGEGARHPERP